MSTPALLCAVCSKPIDLTEIPHLRTVVMGPGGPIKGQFRAYHLECAGWGTVGEVPEAEAAPKPPPPGQIALDL